MLACMVSAAPVRYVLAMWLSACITLPL
jgi:hypothetical protein